MKQTSLLLSLSAMLLLGGCSSKSTLYQMHPVTPQKNNTRHITETVIGVAKVEVAQYLDTPQLITRVSQGELKIHETRRWAGSFAQNIQHVLTEDLSEIMPRNTFLAAPWDEPITDTYRIYLTVDRFDGDANGTVILEGRWGLVNKEEDRLVKAEKVRYIEHSDVTVESIVATQSRLIERLSRRIAQKIKREL